MADSVRKQILDAVVDALEAISTVKTVLAYLPENRMDYEPAKCPACFVEDMDERRVRYAVGTIGDTADMLSTLTVQVSCVIYSASNTLAAARCDLIKEVTLALATDATLAALIQDFRPTTVVTDKGLVRNYSHIDLEFEVDYLYERTVGG